MVKAILQTVVFSLLLFFFVCLCVLCVSRILQNYAKWQLMFTLLPDLGSEFKDIHDTLQGMIGSESSYYTFVFNSARNTTYIMHIYFTELPVKTRYKFCVQKVESTFKHAVARAFHDVYVLPGTVVRFLVE